jgi:hypothetical protein
MLVPMRFATVLRGAALLVLVCLAGPSLAAEGIGASQLGPYLLLGRDGAWSGALEGDTYRLKNPAEPNAIRYLYVDPHAEQPGSWDVSVQIKLEPDGHALAGLIYALQQEPLSYLALLVEDGTSAGLYARSPKGLQPVVAFKAELSADRFATLRILEGDGQFEAFIDGTRVGTVKTDLAGTGAVGIIAGGQGEFLVRDFTLAPAAAAPAAPDSQDPGPATPTPDE